LRHWPQFKMPPLLKCYIFLSLFNSILKYGASNSECSCRHLQISSNDTVTLQLWKDVMGDYRKRSGEVNGKPSYEHVSRNHYLYYVKDREGWAVSDDLSGNGLMLENQEAGECPQWLKVTWRYARARELVYDETLKVTCPSDPCSAAKCGHNAICGRNGTCHCLHDSFTGDPHKR